MTIYDRRELKAQANQAFTASSYNPRKLTLIHTGAAVVLSLILTVLNYILSNRIGQTGGLAGLGLRSVLSTAQMLLGILSMVLMPFWEVGLLFAMLKIARKERVAPFDLLQGFRRFGPVLRLTLLQVLLLVVISILCVNISSMIYMLSPFSQQLAQLILSAEGDIVQAQTLLLENPVVLIPLYVIFLVLFAALAIPMLYRFRLAGYLITEDPQLGALAALGTSHRMMRYNRWALFRLDLSFWWYYCLQILCTVLIYGDLLLEAAGIPLPISAEAAFFGTCILSYAGQLLIAWFFGSSVGVTYATAFQALQHMYKDAEPPLVKNFPWDFLPYQKPDK